MYGKVRFKVLTYLGAGFALFSYLYISGDPEASVYDKLFLPDQPYGIIFYWIAFVACIVAFVLLFHGMHPVTWRYPTELSDHKKLDDKSIFEFSEYVKNEYIEAIKIDIDHCERKQQLTTTASHLLLFGGIVLVIIKNFK